MGSRDAHHRPRELAVELRPQPRRHRRLAVPDEPLVAATPRPQPDPVADAQVNATDVLVGRARVCQTVRGLLPTIVAVDQFRTGGLFDAVNQLNGLSPTP